MWGTLLKNLLSEGRILHLFQPAQAALFIRLEPKGNLEYSPQNEGISGKDLTERRNFHLINKPKGVLERTRSKAQRKKWGRQKGVGPEKMGRAIGLDC